jgi:nicotinamidase-related amidase
MSELQEMLDKIFAEDSELYQQRGFQRRIGFGTRPAIIDIDLANAWTRPNHKFSCDHMDTIIPAMERLLEAGRAKNIPIVHTTTAYKKTTRGEWSDMGLWHNKIPVDVLEEGSYDAEIDERLLREGDLVICKKRASGFHGTYLQGFLSAHRIDTVIVTGVTMAGCVRHTVEDAIAYGFRPIVPRECVGDRVAGVVEWNLFDIDAKFGDVMGVDEVISYLNGIEHFDGNTVVA